MTRRRGFSFAEITVCLAVFSVLMVVVFSIFGWCSSMFQLTNTRIELQGEMRRITGAMRRDILGSCFTSISNHPANITVPTDTAPSYPVVLQRDAISFAAIENITNPANYEDNTGLCQFDRWTVYCPYVADPADPHDCKMLRYRIDKPDRTTSQAPLVGFSAPGVNDNLYHDSHVPATLIPGSVRCYTNRLHSMSIELNPGDQTLEVNIKLRGQSGTATTAQRTTAEIVESTILLKAENTWPKL